MAKALDQDATFGARPSGEPLAERLGLDEAEIEMRRAFAAADRITPDDIADLHELLDPRIPAIVNAFYRHLRQFPNLREFLTSDEKIRGLAATMAAYLEGLGYGIGSPSYVEERLRIGVVHERIGLGPTWYLGAHAMLAEVIINTLGTDCGNDTGRLARLAATLNKVLFFDSSLGIHAYHRTTVTALENTIEKAERAEAELKRLTRIDGLTGVLNRTALMEHLQSELQRFRRYGHEFTVLFLDFDHFKSINDAHGHAFGDHVLVESVSLIRDSTRSIDVIGRYGGEELVVLLVECSRRQGEATAERIRRAIGEHRFRKRKTQVVASVTVSIGLFTPTRRNIKPVTVLRHADRAMYAAKKAGRNCTVTYTPNMGRQ